MDCWTNSLIAIMHSYDFGDICKWNGASSQELNRGSKFLFCRGVAYLKENSTK